MILVVVRDELLLTSPGTSAAMECDDVRGEASDNCGRETWRMSLADGGECLCHGTHTASLCY